MKRKKNASSGLFSFVRVSFCRDSTPFNDVRGWHYKGKVSLLLSFTEKAKLMSFVTFFIKVCTRTRVLSHCISILGTFKSFTFCSSTKPCGFPFAAWKPLCTASASEMFFVHWRCKCLRPGLTALFFVYFYRFCLPLHRKFRPPVVIALSYWFCDRHIVIAGSHYVWSLFQCRTFFFFFFL